MPSPGRFFQAALHRLFRLEGKHTELRGLGIPYPRRYLALMPARTC